MEANAYQADKATEESTDAEIITAGDDAEIVDKAGQHNRLEAYQPLTTGEEIHLRGMGTPDDWSEEIQLVDENERRTVLARGDGMQPTQIYNILVEFAESVGIAEGVDQ